MKKTIFILSAFILISIMVYFKFIKKNEAEILKLTLNGSNIITIYQEDEYKEPGYKAADSKDGDITNKVQIEGKVLSNKIGTYELIYSVTNSKGEKAEAHRFIKVIKKEKTYKDEYDDIDNKVRGWWANNNSDGKRPTGGADINELKKYNAYYMGSNEKVLYLTFDEGSNDTYIKEIVDVLNENNVKATFFLCRKYIEMNADLIRQMNNDGHLIANHTSKHLSMPTLATKENFSKYLKEIEDVEKTYYEVTGETMEKIYREPKGEWSFRSLQILKDLGYKTYFYSAYYLDFNEDVTKETALKELTKKVHNGAIYLIHPKNKGNYLALNSFIKNMKKQGYTFDLVKNIK